MKIGDGASPRIAKLDHGAVEVVQTSNMSIKGKPAGAVCVASVPVEFNHDTDLSQLVSGEARREAEEALEFLARLSAIDARSTHELCSPSPFIGLIADDPNDLAQLDGRPVPLELAETRIRLGIDTSMNILEELGMDPFVDRPEGVALLAEALNARSPLGRYSQFMRLFESAFHLGPFKLTEPLAQLLAGTHYRFTADEVKQWTDARALAVHADRRPEIYLDADVRLFERRMLEAAYDVLVNKARWRSRSSKRRNIWVAPMGSKGPRQNGTFMQQGQRAKLSLEVFDGFMTYPLVREKVPFALTLPRAAWLVGHADAGRLEVLGDWRSESSLHGDALS